MIFYFDTDPPSAPVGPMEYSNETEKSVDITWKVPKRDGGKPITSYVIESRPSQRSTWTKAGMVTPDKLTFTVPDLRVDTEYMFRVLAVNCIGQSPPLEGEEPHTPKKAISEWI